MNLLRGLAFGAFLICLVGLRADAGEGKKVQDLIVGKWRMELKEKQDDKVVTITITVEFSKDGKFKAVEKVGKPIDAKSTKEGTYKIIDDRTLEVAITGDKKTPGRSKIEKLTDSVLNMTGEKGDKYEFKRVK